MPQYNYYSSQYEEPEETIDDLIPTETSRVSKSHRHKSKYKNNIPPTGSTFGAAATAQVGVTNLAGDFEVKVSHPYIADGLVLGPKSDHFSDTSKFLRKKQGIRPHADTKASSERHWEAAPKLRITPGKLAERKPRNFIAENAISVITRKGKKNHKTQGNFMRNPDYGKVPAYLDTIKQEMALEKSYIQEVVHRRKKEELKKQPKMRLLGEDERTELLDALKEKWAQTNKMYQTMTHVVSLDTFGKIKRKEEHEQQLTQLEKSIEKLSKPHVYVQDN